MSLADRYEVAIEGNAAEMEGNRQVQEIYLGISARTGTES
jgi:hypothetical protein